MPTIIFHQIHVKRVTYDHIGISNHNVIVNLPLQKITFELQIISRPSFFNEWYNCKQQHPPFAIASRLLGYMLGTLCDFQFPLSFFLIRVERRIGWEDGGPWLVVHSMEPLGMCKFESTSCRQTFECPFPLTHLYLFWKQVERRETWEAERFMICCLLVCYDVKTTKKK